jgi:hypothetical protein
MAGVSVYVQVEFLHLLVRLRVRSMECYFRAVFAAALKERRGLHCN